MQRAGTEAQRKDTCRVPETGALLRMTLSTSRIDRGWRAFSGTLPTTLVRDHRGPGSPES